MRIIALQGAWSCPGGRGPRGMLLKAHRAPLRNQSTRRNTMQMPRLAPDLLLCTRKVYTNLEIILEEEKETFS